MATDTKSYFDQCRCCLGYGYIKNMWTQYERDGVTEIYGEMLADCFAMEWDSSRDTADQDRICDDCIIRLRDAASFKQMVLDSQDQLQNQLDEENKTQIKFEEDALQPLEEDTVFIVYNQSENSTINTIDNNCNADFDSQNTTDSQDTSDAMHTSEHMQHSAQTGEDKKELVYQEIEFLEDEDIAKNADEKHVRKTKWPKKLPKAERYKRYKHYSYDDVKKALEAAKEGMAVKEAAALYNIPVKTLNTKLRNSDVPIGKITTTSVNPIETIPMKSKITKLIRKTNSGMPNKKLTGLKEDKKDNSKLENDNETKEDLKRNEYLSNELKPKESKDAVVSVEHVRSKYKAVVNAKFKAKKCENDIDKTDINEMSKHRDNIKTVLFNSNATMIKGYWVSSYHCYFCEKQTLSPAELKQHNLEFHKKVIEPIKVKYVSDLVLRLDITDLRCNRCGDTIDTLEDLMTHLKLVHKLTIHKVIKNYMIPFKFDTAEIKCLICNKEYKYFKLLSEHMSEHYNNYECPICERGFINKQSMQTHTYRHKRGVFKCSHCPKIFDTRPKKSCHERLVHTLANKTRKCLYCDERFSTKDLVKSHEVRVHGVEPTIYSCQACSKSYTSKSSLMTHRKRYHLMLRPHKCTYCDMAFFSQIELRSHTVTHTKSREFQCLMCTKKFGTRCSLNQHVRGHLDDRKYKCTYCDRAFVHRTPWKMHMKTKHGTIV